MNTPHTFKCSLCGEHSSGFGHNPEPLARWEQRCCEYCNTVKVIPVRLQRIAAGLNARTLAHKRVYRA